MSKELPEHQRGVTISGRPLATAAASAPHAETPQAGLDDLLEEMVDFLRGTRPSEDRHIITAHWLSKLRAALHRSEGPQASRSSASTEAQAVCEWISVVEDETGDYSTSCGKEFVSLDGEPPTFIKFCCYCGKAARIIPEAALASPSPAPPKEHA